MIRVNIFLFCVLLVSASEVQVLSSGQPCTDMFDCYTKALSMLEQANNLYMDAVQKIGFLQGQVTQLQGELQDSHTHIDTLTSQIGALNGAVDSLQSRTATGKPLTIETVGVWEWLQGQGPVRMCKMGEGIPVLLFVQGKYMGGEKVYIEPDGEGYWHLFGWSAQFGVHARAGCFRLVY
jgi:hypothetical protein